MRRFTLSSKKKGGAEAKTPPSDASLRELVAVREIVRAFLTAERPEEVFQLALDQVSPLVGASFASVYLIDGTSELMRLAASYNWPKRYRPFLGEMRVRIGFGPSGEAAAERRAIEIPDVYADESLEDWQEVAGELGFRSLISLPLQTKSRVIGALAFYFAEPGASGAEKRGLLRLVADQMAATAEKAALIDELRRTNAALTDANAELERQYAAVLEARRVKDEFLANISHELRTPLTAVLGYIALMQEGLSGPLTPDQQRDLGLVMRASERLLHLIEDLLELTTLSRGELEVTREAIDPLDVLKEAVHAVPAEAMVSVRVIEGDAPLPALYSDRKKITRVLVSLLRNGVKFTPQGEVTAWAEARDGRVAFHVRDTGIGIPAGARELVFEEFRQVDGSATRRYGGPGLGLALARRLARLLGGDITVDSEPGAGSTFTLELPTSVEG